MAKYVLSTFLLVINVFFHEEFTSYAATCSYNNFNCQRGTVCCGLNCSEKYPKAASVNPAHMMRDVGEAMNTVALTGSVLLVVNQTLIVEMEKCAVKWFTNARKIVSVNLAKLATTVEA
jgi:hypothetical protein